MPGDSGLVLRYLIRSIVLMYIGFCAIVRYYNILQPYVQNLFIQRVSMSALLLMLDVVLAYSFIFSYDIVGLPY
ncbi:hypothetical protein BD408DRAFT_3293 [Parasitella parasitica]|nr:hypothetical protein BD408DRAFT_3293 [Parasitella parasitica]